MSEFIRRDNVVVPEERVMANDLKAATSKNEETAGKTEQRTLVTPPPSEFQSAVANRSATGTENAPLFASSEAGDLRARWDGVQVSFVDEPRKAVEEADALVFSTMKRLAEIFANERQKLEQQWDRGSDVSTEDFRLALRRYRSFFSRLLAI